MKLDTRRLYPDRDIDKIRRSCMAASRKRREIQPLKAMLKGGYIWYIVTVNQETKGKNNAESS